ncbi:MAG TPA: DUF4351 domain-containing protein, partial [Acidobacteriota bacterium]|nr:DUF4351 domain-containing protein [Acidobacteriota bacterium]
LQQGEVTVVWRLLNRRLGNLPPEIHTQLENLPLTHLDDLTDVLLDFTSIEELTGWLEKNKS